MKVTLLLCSLVLVQFSLYAQKGEYKFENYSVRNGLSQSTVYSIVQDSTGFIWAGTRDGLNRFDGHNFKVFKPGTGENSFSERTIRALIRGDEHIIWLGTDGGGVVSYDTKRGRFTNICEWINPACSDELNVLSLAYRDSILWAGTRENGLVRYDLRTLAIHTFFENRTVWSLAQSNRDKIFAGTDSGAFFIDGVESSQLLPVNTTSALHFDEINNQLWAGTDGSGVMVFDSAGKNITATVEGLKDLRGRSVNAIAKGPKSSIWVGTAASGIFVYNKDKSVTRISADMDRAESLAENNVRSLFLDRNGVMWAGTNTSGISNYSRNRFLFPHYSPEEERGGVSGKVILSFAELSSSEVIVGTERNGLNRFNPKTKECIPIDFLPQTTVVSLMTDSRNRLWIGSDGKGLYTLEKDNYGDFSKSEKVSGLSDESILSMEQLNENQFLVGTYEGLNWLENEKVVRRAFADPNKGSALKGDRILALLKENDEEFWVGTYSGGLSFYNAATDSFVTYLSSSEPGSISSNRVQTIHKDKSGRLWVGTYNGLNLFDPATKTFQVFKEEHGLSSEVIYGILEDENGLLWLSTNNGLSLFDPDMNIFKNFTIEDGLQSNEFNGGAYLKSSDGKFYFGGIDGFNVFDPDNIGQNEAVPNTVITRFHVEGKEMDLEKYSQEFSFGYQESYFLFEFSALEFTKPKKHEYRYKLVGIDENWISTGKKRSVNFSGLLPGSYRFIVQGTNGDGVWGIASEPLNFTIQAPFWETTLFRLLTSIAFLGLLYTAYRYRTFYLLKEEKTRNQIARDLHDDLSATLSSISFFSEAAQRVSDPKEVATRKYLKIIDESAVEAKEKINDIIWAIDPSNDDWSVFLKKCKRFAADAFDSKEINYQLDIADNLDIPMQLEIRQNLWLIFKEIINNLVRHSEATEASVLFKKTGNQLKLKIRDNGIGFKKDGEKKGNGINNLYYRASLIHGKAELTTSPEKGTTWYFEFKV